LGALRGAPGFAVGTRSPRLRGELFRRAAHLAALWTFAAVQPLFQLLERYPEFFAARGAAAADIVALALGIAILPPIVLIGIEWVAGLVDRRLSWALQLVYVGLLVAVIVLQAVPLDAVAATLALAAAAGSGAALGYSRSAAWRSLLSVVSPAVVVSVVLFLLFSNITPLVLARGGAVETASGDARPPVVLVIFDEFPVHSLMDANGRIDARRFSNFARLAADSIWYRDTASVDQDTPYAVPAILDGRLPRRDRLPVAADHPHNIFTLLAGRYELHVREDATALCPPTLCRANGDAAFGERMATMWGDLGLLYAHLVLPDRLENEVPQVTRTWDQLDGIAETRAAVVDTRRTERETKRHRYRRLHANMAGGRARRFQEFVDDIHGGAWPRLHLIHILLPHVPFQYLPSGRRYRLSPREALPGLDQRSGYSVRFLVQQSYQRHLLQLQATDRLLGRLLDRLKAVGIYDRSLVAVVADHGISFRLGHDRRLVRPANVQEIAPVPFFVKAPDQRRGRVSDKPLRTIDVFPTIAELIGVRIPWAIDGRSARTPTVAAQRRRHIVSKKFRHSYPVDSPAYARAKRAALARKLRLFGTNTYAFGPRPDLIGRRLAGLSARPRGEQRALVADARLFRRVDPSTGLVPTHIVGRILKGVLGGGRVVAVAVNGTVVATGRTFTLANSRAEQFSLLMPESALEPGANHLDVLLARGQRLQQLGQAP
jgi:Sulfatase